MIRPSSITIVGIALVGLLLASLILPAIAGLIEGDFEYCQSCFQKCWSTNGNATMTQAISDVYAWSFWRIGLQDEQPKAHVIHLLQKYIKRIRTTEKIQSAASGKTRT